MKRFVPFVFCFVLFVVLPFSLGQSFTDLSRLGRQRKPKPRADTFLAFDGYLPVVCFNKSLDDGL